MSIFELVWPFIIPATAAVIAIIHIRMKNLSGSPAGNPFQREVGIPDAAIRIVGLL